MAKVQRISALRKKPLTRRRTDGGLLCWLALRLSELWDFIDNRDIDKHFISIAVMYGTVKITTWAMMYAEKFQGPNTPLIIAAVCAPYMAMQAWALKSYFDSRKQ